MTRRHSNACLALLCAGSFMGAALTGCGQQIEGSKETEVSKDGTVKTEESSTVRNPDGSITKKETESKTTPPKAP